MTMTRYGTFDMTFLNANEILRLNICCLIRQFQNFPCHAFSLEGHTTSCLWPITHVRGQWRQFPKLWAPTFHCFSASRNHLRQL